MHHFRLVSFFAVVLALVSAEEIRAQSSPPAGSGCTVAALPALPLEVHGRWIVDHKGHRVKLAGVNWYGAEEKDFAPAGLSLAPLEQIVNEIRCMGFNVVRLLWSNELYESNPVVSEAAVAANPQFQGKHAMDVLDAVVGELAGQGLMIVLDNHMSNADWCCSNTDGNTLWYTSQYPESRWIADWQGMAARYRNLPQVIAADLRNEPRSNATWGGSAATDWHAAAERGGNAVLDANPNLIIFVEGVNYAADLTGVRNLPVVLNLPGHLAYEAHDYPFYHSQLTSEAQLDQQLNQSWGYILTPDQPYTAPVWVGEFGTCHTQSSCLESSSPGPYGFWFESLLRYFSQYDLDWSYWALNGTAATGTSRHFGAEETFGILDPYWNAPAIPDELAPPPSINLLGMLQTAIQPLQGPGNSASYPPVVYMTSPVNESVFAAGSTITLSADATTSYGNVSAVKFFANGELLGSVSQAPFAFDWLNVPAGMYALRAEAVSSTSTGATTSLESESALSAIDVVDYSARHPAYGKSIAINFVGWWGFPGTPMSQSEVAGVVPQSNWNNAYGNSGSLSSLADSAGHLTTASVDWTSTNMYSTSIPDAPGNFRMMKGYQDNSNPTVIHLRGLPDSLGPYDVIVYFDGGNGRAARAANYRIVTSEASAAGSASAFFGCPQGVAGPATIISGLDAANQDFSGIFTLAAGGTAGNYVLFPDCHGTSFTLLPVHGASTDSQYRAPINGIQILSLSDNQGSP